MVQLLLNPGQQQAGLRPGDLPVGLPQRSRARWCPRSLGTQLQLIIQQLASRPQVANLPLQLGQLPGRLAQLPERGRRGLRDIPQRIPQRPQEGDWLAQQFPPQGLQLPRIPQLRVAGHQPAKSLQRGDRQLLVLFSPLLRLRQSLALGPQGPLRPSLLHRQHR